jgi:hypothetical protein
MSINGNLSRRGFMTGELFAVVHRHSAAIAACIVLCLLSVGGPRAFAKRLIVPLDGDWEIAESVGADEVPWEFPHTVAVPGCGPLDPR